MGPNYTLEGKYDGPLPPPPEPDAQFKPQTSGDSFRSGLEPRRAEEIAAEKELLESARAFEGFLASAKLADCALLVDTDFGLHRIGAKGGRVLNEKVSFADAIDFYVDLVKRYGPKRDTPVYYLAEPQAQIRWLWSEASEADRKLRPEAVEYARRAWQDELEQLRNKIILEASDQSTWALAWNTLDHDAALVGMNTPEVRSELARLREPPPIPTLTDMERATLQSALWVKEASKHWTEADRKERMEEDRRRAAENPEQNPEKIMQRLEQSQGAAERRLAKLLRDALRP
jgi:hypothetical protein